MAKKILLIEDEKILADMYTDKFYEAQFEVVNADTAEVGLKIAKEENPDLVVLDIILPENNGIYFLRGLRKDKNIGSIPVVVLSNLDDPQTRKEAYDLGALDYLIKTDFTPSALINKIKKYV